MSPVARPLASSTSPRNASTRAALPATSAAKDSLPARSSRVSSRQLDHIDTQLTDIDREVLLFVQSTRLATGAQL